MFVSWNGLTLRVEISLSLSRLDSFVRGVEIEGGVENLLGGEIQGRIKRSVKQRRRGQGLEESVVAITLSNRL